MTSNRKWLDTSVSVDERVNALMAQMTLEDKAGQMNQIANISDKDHEEIIKGRIGSSLIASGSDAGNINDKGIKASLLNPIQKMAIDESRLGIPILFARDVIHGYRTVFPIPLAQAATWDPELIRKGAEITALEASSDGLHWTFTPMIEVCRDPRWGRIAESFGEDPWLASRLAEAAVKGYQGDDLSDGNHLLACVKHYIGYSGAEGGRDYNTVQSGERMLRDVYLPPFAAAVKAGVATVMSSFNEIDGLPVSADKYLLTDVLKKELGFEGFIVSDWGIIGELFTGHKIVGSIKEAASMSANAGLDMDMMSFAYVNNLPELVKESKVSIEQVDDSVRRILRMKFMLGLFEHPYTDESKSEKVIFCEDHRKAARETARDSMVLLKNDGVLPLSKDCGKILVTGPMCRSTSELFGTWTLDGKASDVVPIGEALKKAVEGKSVVHIDSGFGYGDLTLLLARDSDVVIACIGEAPWRSGEGNSITDIVLPPGQEKILREVHSLGVKIVAVVFGGRPLVLNAVAQYTNAIIYAWHPGVEGALALTDIIFGDHSPKGRLPVTFPRATGQIPIYYNYKPTNRPLPLDNRKVGRYRDILDSPLYPFGYGLDYTTYSYSNLKVSSQTIKLDQNLLVSIDLTNTGKRSGTETVQLYIRDVVGSVTRPVKELKGFTKISLDTGETKTVTFELSPKDLAFTNKEMKTVVESGDFLIWVGPNAHEGLESFFTLV